MWAVYGEWKSEVCSEAQAVRHQKGNHKILAGERDWTFMWQCVGLVSTKLTLREREVIAGKMAQTIDCGCVIEQCKITNESVKNQVKFKLERDYKVDFTVCPIF